MIALAALLMMIAPAVPGGSGGCWTAPVVAPISDPFRAPSCPYCAGNRGIEFDTVPGQRVGAVAAGTVVFAGSVAGARYVTVTVDGVKVTVGPLASIATTVFAGAHVSAATMLGSAGEFLLLTVRQGGAYVDPAPWLGAPRYPPRLEPTAGRAPPRRPIVACAPPT